MQTHWDLTAAQRALLISPSEKKKRPRRRLSIAELQALTDRQSAAMLEDEQFGVTTTLKAYSEAGVDRVESVAVPGHL